MIDKVHACEFGWLPVVRQTRDFLTVRHPTYGEFVLRCAESGRYHFNQDDYREMLRRIEVLHLHIPDLP